MDVPVAADVLGTSGAVCWSVQLIPQIIINIRRHDTTGLQPTMMLLWAAAGIPLGVYNIVQAFNIALQIQPQILTFLSLVTWTQCKYYGHDTKWPWPRCVLAVILLGLIMAGVELGLIYALRQAVIHETHWPTKLMAILSAVLLCAGVLRHYWDIYKEQTVRGISFIFVGIDAMGDLTSLVSILFQPELDILGIVIYGSELVLWLGVFACGGWFDLRPRVQQFLDERRSKRLRAPRHGSTSRDPENYADHSSPVDSVPRLSSSSSTSTVFRTASGQLTENEVRLRSVMQT